MTAPLTALVTTVDVDRPAPTCSLLPAGGSRFPVVVLNHRSGDLLPMCGVEP